MTPVIPYFDSDTPPNLIVTFTATNDAATFSADNITINDKTASVAVAKDDTVIAHITVTFSEQSVSASRVYTLNLTRPGDANAPAAESAMATGGELRFIKMSSGQSDYDEVHIFRTTESNTTITDTLTVTRAPASAKVFIVAGGGGGGKADSTHSAFGGGAGGVIKIDNQVLPVGDYAITVGKGGIGGNITAPITNPNNKKAAIAAAYNGANSSIVNGSVVNLVAKGGGGGGWHVSSNASGGGDGGSGGGGLGSTWGNGGAGSGTQGKAGGSGNGAGGGGYSGAGSLTAGGAGLANPYTDITGIPADGFAGGGSSGLSGATASHGGGARVAGTLTTGGGGAGGTGSDGYEGGSGIVIVRFAYIAEEE
jgi:hypothetical protein